MGLKLSITIVDTKNNLKIKDGRFALGGEIVLTENLSPDDLHIGFYKDKIILLNEVLFKIVNDKPELNFLEKGLNQEFKECGIIHFLQFDTISLAGYVVIENGKKSRAKLVIEDELYLDDENLSEYEIQAGEDFKNAMFEEYPKLKSKIEQAINNKSPKDELIYLLELKNKLLKDGITYFNGNLELEIIHKLIPYFIDSHCLKLCELEFVKYPNVDYESKNLNILRYISDAYNRLKNNQ